MHQTTIVNALQRQSEYHMSALGTARAVRTDFRRVLARMPMRPRSGGQSAGGSAGVTSIQPHRGNRGAISSPAAVEVPDSSLLTQVLTALVPILQNGLSTGQLANLQVFPPRGQQAQPPLPLPAPELPAHEEPAAESDNDSMVALETLAQKNPMKKVNAETKADAKAKAKAKAKVKAKAKAKAKANASLKRPAAVAKRPAAHDYLLGCSRCRWNHGGCADSFKNGKLSVKGCRNPTFGGKRRTM